MLRTCPFCGSRNLSVDHLDENSYIVSCEECGATGPSGETSAKARRVWNERRGVVEVVH